MNETETFKEDSGTHILSWLPPGNRSGCQERQKACCRLDWLIKVWLGHQRINAYQNFLKFTKKVELLKGDALWFSKFELCTVYVTYTQFSFFHLDRFF